MAACESIVRRLGVLLVGGVALFMMLAGLMKIRDFDLFRESLESWGLIPGALRTVAATTVPIVEIGLGLAWLLGFHRRVLSFSMLGLNLAFTGTYGLHRVLGYRPECNCLGELLRVRASERQADALLLRNGVLIGLLVAGSIAAYRPRGRAYGTPDEEASVRTGRSRGFTMVETLVTVTVVAVLAVILLPALGVVRNHARSMADSSNLRQHVAIITQYTSDWGGINPLFLNPNQPRSTLRWHSQNGEYELRYFLSCLAWPIALADGYYDGQINEDMFWSPLEPVGATEIERSFATTSYSYPCAFIASPVYWDPATRLADPAAQSGVTRAANVRYPAAKAILVRQLGGFTVLDDLGSTGAEALEVAMYDGSVGQYDAAQGVSASVFADGTTAVPEWSFHLHDWPRLHHTPGGILGLDIIQR